MNRFFVKEEQMEDKVVKIEGQDYKHISRSLRLQPGDKIIVCTGDGFDYLVELKKFYNNEDLVIGRILSEEKNMNEPNINITLAQSIPKNRNMELVAEKATELGVHTIIPLSTQRTVVKLKEDKKEKRIQRWQRIVEEAAKQSQRGIIPQIKDLYSIEDIPDIAEDYDLILIFWTNEDNININKIFSKFFIEKDKLSNILVLIGPEGGFTYQEVELVTDIDNSYSVSLGPRILRTETAGLAVLSVILYEIGELGS